MNPRRSNGGTLSPVAAASAAERDVLDAAAFRRMVAFERKRSERSRKPFMLLLLDMGEQLASEENRKTLGQIFAALAESSRETDLVGWYAEGCVIGVVFTEIALGESDSIPAAIIERVTAALRANLSAAEFEQLSFSFHIFPEDWNLEDDHGPANPALYPDLAQRNRTNKWFRGLKRAMDIAGSLLALVLFSPVFLIVPLAIKLTSEGPVFFRQPRVGQYGKTFVFLKFRSMFMNNDAAAHKSYVQQLIAGKAEKQPSDENGEGVYKLAHDPRITRVGAFLRKTSLDEIPQFFNVLRGEMSLVGPRPPLSYEVEAYDIWHRRRLLEAKPGITGLWQVCGRSRVKFDDMVRLDLQYARTWSPWMDIKILARTPGAVVLGEGAH